MPDGERTATGYWDLESRLREVEQAVTALPYLVGDITEIRESCGAIRKWVEERDRDRKREEQEKERLSLGWWAAIIGGVAIFLSSIVSAIAQLSG